MKRSEDAMTIFQRIVKGELPDVSGLNREHVTFGYYLQNRLSAGLIESEVTGECVTGFEDDNTMGPLK